MRIALLGDQCRSMIQFMEACGDSVAEEGTPTAALDFIISFNYAEILPKVSLESVDYKAINIHIGALPWNRGAHPNYWSWHDGTPAGVTLHWMTEGLDKGEIIAQRRIAFGPFETYRTSYLRLQAEARALFMEYWPEIKQSRGSYHRADELPSGLDWNAPVERKVWETK